MKLLLNSVKIALLLAALLAAGWSVLPGTAEADISSQVTCEGEGHTCHADIGGKTYHLKKVAETY